MRKSFFLIGIFLICACNNKGRIIDFLDEPTPNFIETYLVPESMELEAYGSGIVMVFNGRMIGQGKEGYNDLAERYGDISYNRARPTHLRYLVLDRPLLSVDITCDKKWDDEHPAGASLRDLVNFYGDSLLRYIESSYKDWNDIPFSKNLGDVSENDLTLLASRALSPGLQLQTLPCIPGDYTFTVTVTTESDLFTADITITL